MRDNTISIAKAFAIILMVLAHTSFLDIGNKWINMFHMPLFFFFAGYCFKSKYLIDFKSFASKRISGLYKPFVKWSIVFLALHNLFFFLNIYNDEYGFKGEISHLYSVMDYIKRSIAIVTSMSGNEQLLGGYWFLKTLFVGSFIGYFFIRYVTINIGGGILFALTMIISAFNLSLPYFHVAGREFFAALIFVMGYNYKAMNLEIHRSWLTIPVGLLLVTLGVSFWQASLLQFNWMQVGPFLISAMAGILMIFKLSSYINDKNNYLKRLLVFIGDHTLMILTWHFLCFKIVSLIIIYYEKLPIKRLAEFPVITDYSCRGYFVLYLIVGIVAPLVLTKTKYLR